jgi:hypothetical protein
MDRVLVPCVDAGKQWLHNELDRLSYLSEWTLSDSEKVSPSPLKRLFVQEVLARIDRDDGVLLSEPLGDTGLKPDPRYWFGAPIVDSIEEASASLSESDGCGELVLDVLSQTIFNTGATRLFACDQHDSIEAYLEGGRNSEETNWLKPIIAQHGFYLTVNLPGSIDGIKESIRKLMDFIFFGSSDVLFIGSTRFDSIISRAIECGRILPSEEIELSRCVSFVLLSAFDGTGFALWSSNDEANNLTVR